MTRKDYIRIAEALRLSVDYAIYKNSEDARAAHALICEDIATALHADNVRFNRTKFLAACGLEWNVADNL